MTPIEALHTVARRYCIECLEFCRQHYKAAAPEAASENDPATSCSYPVANAILQEVERIPPADFATAAEALAWIQIAGEAAQSVFTGHNSPEKAAANAAERARFAGFIGGYAAAQQGPPEPLPYRRTIGAAESRTLWVALSQRWEMSDHYWYPLTGPEPAHSIVFAADSFDEHFGTDRLRALLIAAGIRRVYQLSEGAEYDAEYEMDAVLMEPYYTGLERHYTDHTFDWHIYASHENSLTIAGEALIAALKAAWPDWERYLWQGIV